MTIEGDATRNIYINGRLLTPQRSQALWNHSPDGFNWGYGGSGPAQLALAILLAAGLDDQRAMRLHQAFKWAVITSLPQGEGFVLEIDVTAWVATNDVAKEEPA
jgi:Family of unknown function (DUF6166)